MRVKTRVRNLIILAAHKAGTSTASLAAQFHLTENRIMAIVIAERHKVAVSQDPEYRRLRKQVDGHEHPRLGVGRRHWRGGESPNCMRA
jgi:hypothetical protein